MKIVNFFKIHYYCRSLGTKKAFCAIWLVTSKVSLKSFYIYSRDSKNYRCQKNVWLLVTWYDVTGCHCSNKIFWKKVYHFYTNRTGIKNALKIIHTPDAKNQYFKSYKHSSILKKPEVNYIYNGKKFLLKHDFKKFWSLELLCKFSCGLHGWFMMQIRKCFAKIPKLLI